MFVSTKGWNLRKFFKFRSCLSFSDIQKSEAKSRENVVSNEKYVGNERKVYDVSLIVSYIIKYRTINNPDDVS